MCPLMQRDSCILNCGQKGYEGNTMEEIKKDEIQESVETVAAPEKEADDELDVGNVKISMDVVATIAGIAASQISGVSGMYQSFAGGIAERFGAKQNPAKGVKVELSGNNAKIDVYIVVDFGVRIPELAWEVQESVKKNVETMTGLVAESVNIHIEGVNFEKADSKTVETVIEG